MSSAATAKDMLQPLAYISKIQCSSNAVSIQRGHAVYTVEVSRTVN